MTSVQEIPTVISKEISKYLQMVEISYAVILSREFDSNVHRMIHSNHAILEDAVKQLLFLCEKHKIEDAQHMNYNHGKQPLFKAYITLSFKKDNGTINEYCLSIFDGWITLFSLHQSFSSEHIRLLDCKYISDSGLHTTYMDNIVQLAAISQPNYNIPIDYQQIFTSDNFRCPEKENLHVVFEECQRINKSQIIKEHRKRVRNAKLMDPKFLAKFKDIGGIENFVYRGVKFTWED